MVITRIAQRGFTLIEMSIVLVIIGLIVGGVLVGQSLIKAAQVRATITQIEKYNTAVNTFYGKYGYLPGDIPATPAAAFGFAARGTQPGQGDGNGVIQGNLGGSFACGWCGGDGEAALFWADLSVARLIDGSFPADSQFLDGPQQPGVSGGAISQYLPTAKAGTNNYIYVWSGGPTDGDTNNVETGNDSRNYFGLSAVSYMVFWEIYTSPVSPGLTVQQAYAIDKKVDDGLPQSGSVIASYLDFNTAEFNPIWVGTGGQAGAAYTTATPGSSTTCFDNSTASSGTPGVAGAAQHYSLEISNGSNGNCALSFQFQ